MIQPKVSIVVPVYKVEKYLSTCLDSLINQTYQNWEAILVDDGSPDNSGVICDEYAEKDSRFKVIHKQNGGLSSARNAAIPIVQGEYVFYLDSDDFIHTDALNRLIVLAQENRADIVQCGFVRGSDAIFPELPLEEKLGIYDNHTIFTSFVAKIITCGKLYRREVIGDICFPEGLINEDDFTTWKFYYRASKIVVTSIPYYYYTVNPNSIMANKKKKADFRYFDAYRERIKFFQDNSEEKLEAVTRVQWMKSLVLSASKRMLTHEQKFLIMTVYQENYSALYSSSFRVPRILDLIFKSYKISPYITSLFVSKLYNCR